MARDRRRLGLLAALIVLLLGVVLYRAWPRPAGPPASPSTAPGAATSAGGRAPVSAPDVHLEALEAERPVPSQNSRNLFRFRAARPPAPPAGGVVDRPPGSLPDGPAAAPPPPPIPLKFIGVVQATEHAKKLAVLSDARGVYHGAEGDIIEGRYRIVRIGTDSIDLEYADGRGRQTIRLSGS